MSDHQDYGRPTPTGTGPDGQSLPPTPEPVADAAVYRDVTGRPIPLAPNWERPDGERPRSNAHQAWAGAAASFGDDSGSLFAADTRQTRAEYQPPVSYPATAGGSAFFNGARQAANEQQAAQSGGLPVNAAPTPTQRPVTPVPVPPPPAPPAPAPAPAPPAPWHSPPPTPAQTRLRLPDPVPLQPQPVSYREREPVYQYDAPGGSERDARYDTFEDYQTGAQPVVQDWNGSGPTGNRPDPYRANDDGRPDAYGRAGGWNEPEERPGAYQQGDWRQPNPLPDKPVQHDLTRTDLRADAYQQPGSYPAPAAAPPDAYPQPAARAPEPYQPPVPPEQREEWRQPAPRPEEPRREEEYAREDRYRDQDRALGREPVRGQGSNPEPAPGSGSQALRGAPGTPNRDRDPGWPLAGSSASSRPSTPSGGFAPEPFARSPEPNHPNHPGPPNQGAQLPVWGGQDEFGGRRLLGDPDNEPNYGSVPRHDRNRQLNAGQPPRGGRDGGRRMSTRRKVGLVALVIVALAVGRFVSQMGSDKSGIHKLFLRDGSVGETVDLRYADITATAVRGSACLVTPASSTAFRSPGVFVVVPVTIVVRGKTASLQYAAIEDTKGRVYGATATGRGGFNPGTAQVGVPRYATVAIEMPRDAIPGARLQIGLDSLYLEQDDITDIDLGVTPAQVDQWASNDRAVFVPTSSDQPPTGETSSSECAGPVAAG